MKQVNDFIITDNQKLGSRYSRMTVSPADGSLLPEILPGQFVQIATGAPGVFLRRPISVNDVDYTTNTLKLLIAEVGTGTKTLVGKKTGEIINILLPLGNSFPLDVAKDEKALLIGGGVGVAPLLYLGRKLAAKGVKVEFLLGARSEKELVDTESFASVGTLYLSTDDGSCGSKGLVTQNPCLNETYSRYYCCGPVPMMKAVASLACAKGIECYVSLENMMACGLGACLCCVEKTVKGNVCVCTEGPVFNIDALTW